MLPLPGKTVLLAEVIRILVSAAAPGEGGIISHSIGYADIVMGGTAAAGSPSASGSLTTSASLAIAGSLTASASLAIAGSLTASASLAISISLAIAGSLAISTSLTASVTISASLTVPVTIPVSLTVSVPVFRVSAFIVSLTCRGDTAPCGCRLLSGRDRKSVV